MRDLSALGLKNHAAVVNMCTSTGGSLNDATLRKTAKETGSKGISKILRGDMHEGRIEDEDEGMAQRQPGKSQRRRQQKEELKGKN